MANAVSIPVQGVARPLTAEMLNQWTHGFGCVLACIGASLLIPRAFESGGLVNVVGATVYAASLVGLYLASTLSHSFEHPGRRRFYRMLDQVCIFLLTAGSFTPFGLVHMATPFGWSLLIGMWLVALYGIALRIRNADRTIGVPLFVVLGWAPLLALPHLYTVTHWHGLLLVLVGALSYTGGLYFLLNDHRKIYFHAIWHFATITGSACHFLFHFWYVVNVTPTPSA